MLNHEATGREAAVPGATPCPRPGAGLRAGGGHLLEGENAEGSVRLVAGVLGHPLAPEVVGESGGHGSGRPHVGVVHDGPDVVMHELAPQRVAVAQGAQPRQHRRCHRSAAPPARRRRGRVGGGRRGSVPAAGAQRRARHHGAGAGRRAGCPGSAAAAAREGSGARMVRGGQRDRRRPLALCRGAACPAANKQRPPPRAIPPPPLPPPPPPARMLLAALSPPPPPRPAGGVGSARGGPRTAEREAVPARRHPREAVPPAGEVCCGAGSGALLRRVAPVTRGRQVQGCPPWCQGLPHPSTGIPFHGRSRQD